MNGNYNDHIKNVSIYGLEKSMRTSGYPMVTNTSDAIPSDKRCSKLSNVPIGSGHDNFLKGIIVQWDWKVSKQLMPQLERYRFLDIVSSQSTMHRLKTGEFTYNEYTSSEAIELLKREIDNYNSSPTHENFLRMIYSAPCGLELTMGMSTNYLQLKTIYTQRRNHRLNEWQEFCKFIETLPHSDWITGEGENA